MKAIADNSEGDPSGIKAHFRMDDSGILNLDSVRIKASYFYYLRYIYTMYLLVHITYFILLISLHSLF